jgi:hypothetical protein
MKFEFSREFFEKYPDVKFMKIGPMGEQLSHADGQTGRRTVMTKLTVAFGNLTNTPKQGKSFQRMKKSS